MENPCDSEEVKEVISEVEKEYGPRWPARRVFYREVLSLHRSTYGLKTMWDSVVFIIKQEEYAVLHKYFIAACCSN